MDDDNGEVNPYRELIVNNAEKIEMAKIPDGTMVNIKLIIQLCAT